jgi:hypothetical protein
MHRGRIEKTIEKIRNGRLPPMPDLRPVVETGDGNLCSGCGEIIRPIDELYRPRVVPFRFHDICYYVWTTFER